VTDILDSLTQRVAILYGSILHTYTSVHNHIFTVVASQRLSSADVPLPLGSRTVTGLSYQLLTTTAHNDGKPEVLQLTNPPTNSLSSNSAPLNNSIPSQSQSQNYVNNSRSVGQSVLFSSTHLGTRIIFLLLSESTDFFAYISARLHRERRSSIFVPLLLSCLSRCPRDRH
jgi:hypothetical protein